MAHSANFPKYLGHTQRYLRIKGPCRGEQLHSLRLYHLLTEFELLLNIHYFLPLLRVRGHRKVGVVGGLEINTIHAIHNSTTVDR